MRRRIDDPPQMAKPAPVSPQAAAGNAVAPMLHASEEEVAFRALIFPEINEQARRVFWDTKYVCCRCLLRNSE